MPQLVVQIKPVPLTNANIDIDELEFSLVPLTKKDLAIEVDAWLTLLKEKATIVSEAEILVSQKQKKILAAQEISDISAYSAYSAKLIKTSKEGKAAAQLKEELAEIKVLAQDLVHKKADKAVESMEKHLIAHIDT